MSRRALPGVIAAVLLVAACSPQPSESPDTAATARPAASSAPSATPSEIPFAARSWPAAASACGTPGYTGEIGRIEAPDAQTVRFRLCVPDGAFPAKLAHPSLGILDSATLEALAGDPQAARAVAGAGPYRVERWDSGEVILVAAGDSPTAPARAATVVIRWDPDASRRVADLQAAAVDGIDAPAPAELDSLATQPELTVVPRDGLATAYLGFGTDKVFDDLRVRRAIGSAIDRSALAGAFPDGSVAADHLAPCVVPAGCAGADWYEFNAPLAASDLATAKFDLRLTYPLHVAAAPVPGLPDPVAAALALASQLRDGLGLQLAVDAMDPAAFADGVAGGTLDGLYLAGIASTVSDPSAFLEPLLGDGVESTAAARSRGVSAALATAAGDADLTVREGAFAAANDAVRANVPVVPLVHPGGVAAFRADVGGVSVSPLGADPLGSFTPGDRSQVTFLQASDPGAAWCGATPSPDAYRLCALVGNGLYATDGSRLDPVPALATRCTAAAGATTWTCVLRRDVTFDGGATLDAGDVLSTFVALWDARSALRATRPADAFAAWDALFGPPFGTPAGG